MKTQTTQHTPGPFTIEMIAHATAEVAITRSVNQRAAFILRAVNSHDELLDLVKELYGYCGSRLNNAACIRVEEAIAEGEGRP